MNDIKPFKLIDLYNNLYNNENGSISKLSRIFILLREEYVLFFSFIFFSNVCPRASRSGSSMLSANYININPN